MPGGKRSVRLLSPTSEQCSEAVTSSTDLESSPKSIMKHPVTSSPGRQNHHHHNSSRNDPFDSIQTLSLEEVHISSPQREDTKGRNSSRPTVNRKKPKSAVSMPESSSYSPAKSGGSGSIVNSQGADSDIIRSGHQELDTLYASNDCQWRGPLTVNLVNAPNNSTVQCGCENINCPFCNLLLSIEQMDPSVLQ